MADKKKRLQRRASRRARRALLFPVPPEAVHVWRNEFSGRGWGKTAALIDITEAARAEGKSAIIATIRNGVVEYHEGET